MRFRTNRTSFASIFAGSLFGLLTMTAASGYAESHPADPVPKVLALEEGKITVKITSTSLREVMEEVGRLIGVEVSWSGKGTGRTVSVNLSDLSVEDAVRRILRKENYVLFYSPNEDREELSRILVLPRNAGRSRAQRAGREDPVTTASRLEEMPEDGPSVYYDMDQFDEKTRRWAEPIAELLEDGQTAEAAEELKWALTRDRNPQVRLMALEGLSMLGPDSAEEMIETALNDPDPIVRAHARQCLKLHVDEDPRIREFLHTGSP